MCLAFSNALLFYLWAGKSHESSRSPLFEWKFKILGIATFLELKFLSVFCTRCIPWIYYWKVISVSSDTLSQQLMNGCFYYLVFWGRGVWVWGSVPNIVGELWCVHIQYLTAFALHEGATELSIFWSKWLVFFQYSPSLTLNPTQWILGTAS
jgi:hypothetical protein